ncbi:hypothetical protein BH18ACI4_BH18ACI4_20370 [soil metagenome]
MDWNRNRELVKQKCDRQGYVFIPQFLNTDEVEELRREIERYIEDVVPQIPSRDVYFEVKDQPETIKQLIRMSQYDSYFEKLKAVCTCICTVGVNRHRSKSIVLSANPCAIRCIFNDRFVKLAELLLGCTVIGKNMQWFNKPTGVSRATPPHQDGYYIVVPENWTGE